MSSKTYNTKLTNSNFQGRSSLEGRAAQEIASAALVGCGFTVLQRNAVCAGLGVTANYIVADAQGNEWYIDVSGSFTSDRSGLIRSDTVWKALGRASVLALNKVGPVLLLTTNLPSAGSVGDIALRATRAETFFDAIVVTSPSDRTRLRQYAQGQSGQRPLPGFWTPQEIHGPSLQESNVLGATRSAPLAVTGDPLGQIVPGGDIIGMNHRLKVFVPSCDRSGRLVRENDLELSLAKIQDVLVGLGGGFTSQRARGHWVDPLGGIADEDVVVLEVYSVNLPTLEAINRMVSVVLNDLDQEVAAIVLNDYMYQFSR